MAATVVLGGKSVRIDATSISVKDALDIEEAFGGTFDEWAQALQASNLKAAVVAVWVLARKSAPDVTLEDVYEADVFELVASLQANDKKPSKSGGKSVRPTKAV